MSIYTKMKIAKLYSRALIGMNAPQVIVEVHVAAGLPSFSIVGLPDTEVKESRDRVRSAIQNSGFDFPARRITVNLAPADLPKESGRYDLPIALAILIASNLIQAVKPLADLEFAGELALDGELRPVKGALAIAYGASNSSRQFILPAASANEATLIDNIQILQAQNLKEVCDFLSGKAELIKSQYSTPNILTPLFSNNLGEVRGQLGAKKALELAAAGRHSLLMIGTPGCGKSMLASRISSILPPLTNKESIESASLYSLTHSGFNINTWQQAPYRAPHHSISGAALIGGGSNPKPGEISLAHNGVLFLDELPEFTQKALEALREPLETKKVNIARVNQQVEYLADFQLIAAMNPCPCGNLGHVQKNCTCSVEQIRRYQNKISGPLLDRIDLIVEVPTIKTSELQGLPDGETSEVIAKRVIDARQIQYQRQNKLNYKLNNQEIETYCQMDQKAKQLSQLISDKEGFSARSYYRLLKLARTIADLACEEKITTQHLAQANQYKFNMSQV